MSATQSEILTREEMAALLDSIEAARSADEGSARFLSGSAAGRPDEDPKRRAEFERAVDALGRDLSSAFQTRIRLQLTSVESLVLGEVEELSSESETVVLFELEGIGAPGALVVGRSLFFDWLNRTLGGRPGASGDPTGGRPYTAIERRMLRRLATDWLSTLSTQLPNATGKALRVCGVESPRALRDWPTAKAVWWSVEVHGLGELGRLRVAWPLAALSGAAEASTARSPLNDDPLRRLLLDAPVVVCAEVGSTDIALSRLASLAVGDVLPLDVRDDGRLIVRIEGLHKYDAIRGAVDNRAAFQIVRCRPCSGGDTRG